MELHNKALEKIQFCIKDVDDFKDLIQINDSDVPLLNRYELLAEISVKGIRNRVENLIIACWSAKDYFKKNIKQEIDEATSSVFEKKLFEHEETHLIQYLADALKHGGIDNNFLKNNIFKHKEPKIGSVILILSNQSVKGTLKPFFSIEGEESVSAFSIKDVQTISNGKIYYNYDTILLTMRIINVDNDSIANTVDLVSKYISILTRNYKRIMQT